MTKTYSTTDIMKMADKLYLAICNKQYDHPRQVGFSPHAKDSLKSALLTVKDTIKDLEGVLDDQIASLD